MKPASTSPEVGDAPGLSRTVDLDITGMTCAACASRIERKLNKLDGVTAAVNYATEKARVQLAATPLSAADLIATIEATGYGAMVPDPDLAPIDRAAFLRRRLLVAIALGLPVLLLSMVPALQFDGWQWVALALATPVATWAAWPFHRAMALNLRHGQATMDTLISVGVVAAYAWSLWALLFTAAGDIGMEMTMSMPGMSDEPDAPHIYLEVASTVVAFILAGRYFEARAKRRAGDAIRALLDLGAKDVAVLAADGTERRVPVEQLRVGDRFVVRPGEKVATDGEVIDGASAIDRSLVTGESVPVDVGPGDQVVGATVNTNGRLVVRATRVGGDTQLAQMARLVEDAQSGKAPVQRLADRVSAVFVPIVIGLALLTLARLVGSHRRRAALVQRRGRRAHHRVPVRAGPGYPDGALGGHRSGCTARAAHQGPRDPREHATCRHDRARQDRDRHHGVDDPGRGASGRRARPHRRVAARGCARGRQ